MDFGVNYLGHFYLTYLLWPLLRKSSAFRVINLASVTHKKMHLTLWGQPKIDFEDLNFTKKYNSNQAYAKSKLCIVMSTYWIAKKLGPFCRDKVVSVHPGIVRTQIMSEVFTLGLMGRIVRILWLAVYPVYAFLTKNIFEGNRTTMYCLL